MLKYGGRFENYFSRHRVTHIICSNLPDSKVKNLRFDFMPLFKFGDLSPTHRTFASLKFNYWMVQYRAFSAGLPVVKPTWILDSVAANRLLSCKFLHFSFTYFLFPWKKNAYFVFWEEKSRWKNVLNAFIMSTYSSFTIWSCLFIYLLIYFIFFPGVMNIW